MPDPQAPHSKKHSFGTRNGKPVVQSSSGAKSLELSREGHANAKLEKIDLSPSKLAVLPNTKQNGVPIVESPQKDE